MSNHNKLNQDEVNDLSDRLANLAFLNNPGNTRALFTQLILSSRFNQQVKMQRVGALSGAPKYDALLLVQWANGLGINPEARNFTFLGTLLFELMKEGEYSLDVENQRHVAALVLAHGLINDPTIINTIKTRYNVPSILTPSSLEITDEPISFGLDFSWQGPTDAVSLQSFFKPTPDLFDVGYLKKAIECASSVCRIEIDGQKVGTGFLVAPNSVITNHHVLAGETQDDFHKNLKSCLLQFGALTGYQSHTFHLDQSAPLKTFSQTEKLDYVLLQVEDGITSIEEIKPITFADRLPVKGDALNILQHPQGENLMLSLSRDGVVNVLHDRSYVQYTNPAKGGSSGSPCFDEDWKVVALHRLERARWGGAIREGVLMQAILAEIETYLS